MACLVDTSILARLANTADQFHSVAMAAIVHLHRGGEVLYVAPQNLVEFRSFATRPVSVNGLGLEPHAVEQQTDAFESVFPLLPETPAIYPAWKRIARQLSIRGKQVHDARLAAICEVHAVNRVLTFNVGHFQRFTTVIPALEIVAPDNVPP